MANQCKGIRQDGHIHLYFDEVNIIRKALRKLLFSFDKKADNFIEQMLIINTYQKITYKDAKKGKENKFDKINTGKNKG